ncbi:MAG: hypothetical protein OWT27_10915 [Firmicutes bacterium]|nr:hypothetical protein [Bacillota bacterium]
MRTAGAVFIVLGAVIAYLGWTGKLEPAWYALIHGTLPPAAQTSPNGDTELAHQTSKTGEAHVRGPVNPYKVGHLGVS